MHSSVFSCCSNHEKKTKLADMHSDLHDFNGEVKFLVCFLLRVQAMSRTGLAGPPMENHMDMSHLQMPKHMSIPPQEEPSDLEELEQFAKAFKQRRIKLGFTQVIIKPHRVLNPLKDSYFVSKGEINARVLFIAASRRGTWAWPWGSCTGTTSARPPSPASRRSTSASRTCAS